MFKKLIHFKRHCLYELYVIFMGLSSYRTWLKNYTRNLQVMVGKKYFRID